MRPTLSDLLAKLPTIDKDGNYFELRKQGPLSLGYIQWVCAKINLHTNAELCNNIGMTPEEAVAKMLQRLNVDIRDPHAACIDACETAYIRLLQLPANEFRFDPRTQKALSELRDALALSKGLDAKSAVDEYTDLAMSDMTKQGDNLSSAKRAGLDKYVDDYMKRSRNGW